MTKQEIRLKQNVQNVTEDTANLHAIRNICAEYLLDRIPMKEAMIRIIQIAMNGERG